MSEIKLPKEIGDQINNIIAAYTQAWENFTILDFQIVPGNITSEDIMLTCRIAATRKKNHPLHP